MRRRTSLTAALALGTAWALTACGIPTDKAPEIIGDAPTDFDDSSGASLDPFAPTSDARETVGNFLKAAAGDPAGLDDRLNLFTDTGEQQFSESSEDIRLLADLDLALQDSEDLRSATVTVTGAVVGIYLDDGSVRMHSTPANYSETFTLQRGEFPDTWKMTSVPRQVALDYAYFGNAYEQAPLYFQAGQAPLLVPDLRWIYSDLAPETRRRLLLDWLVTGPSEFASQSASNAIPSNTTSKSSDEDGTVQVELSLEEDIDDDEAEAIAAEIVWSLGLEGEFILTANGEDRAGGTLMDWRIWNAIPVGAELPETAYFIAEETVWEYTSGQRVTMASPDHPWVGFGIDGLQQVAVEPGGEIAAIVAGPGGEILQIGTEPSAMRTIADIGGNLTDPQWLDDDLVIVVVDGTPTAVVPSSGATQTLTVGDEMSALALSADGRRMAYVEDGLAWVAPLVLDVDRNITVGDPRQIGQDIENVTDVAWSSENYLWVAGERGDDQLFRVAIDNSHTEPQAGTETFPQITQIAANPADPVRSTLDRGEPVIIVANATLYRVHTTGLDEVRNEETAVAGSAPFTVL